MRNDGQRHCACVCPQRYSVVLCDVEQRFLERGFATITKNLEREVAKNKSPLIRKERRWRIELVTDRARLADCDFIVEAATERFEDQGEDFSRSRPVGAA